MLNVIVFAGSENNNNKGIGFSNKILLKTTALLDVKIIEK